ncbi:MAG: fibronectin type III domain-containing protein, partial [Demequina sp.]|uniref:fibronectin type III domain-containing protein n=1 Tax=Demequina sp. TaxID=2050685 RepID=UPI003A8524C3
MTPTVARFRTPIAVLTAAALSLLGVTSAAAAGPDGALDASDLGPGAYASDTVVGDFTLRATAAKGVTVDASDRLSDRGDVYTQRVKLNGSGDAAQRSVAFTADGPAEVIVHARSSSGTADRALALFDEAGTEVDRVPALADDDGAPIATETLDVPAAGEYWIASPSSGVNVYYLQLGADAPVDRAAWADVVAPVVDSVVLDPDDPSRLLVTATGLVGTDGADLARATLMDAAGTVVDRALSASDGASSSLALTPPASGAYTVQVALTRAGEPDALVSDAVAAPAFSLPLAAPEVTGALTTAVAAGGATVTLDWTAVKEAETYSVEVDGGGGFVEAVAGVVGTSADLTGLTPGASYQARVVAHRGEDAATGPAAQVAVAAAVERWLSADIGSNAGTGGSITDNGDGTITFDARASSTKLASSEDGFQYFYTAVDPATENF